MEMIKKYFVGWLILGLLAGAVVLPHFVFGVVRYTSQFQSTCLDCHENIKPGIWEQSPIHRVSVTCDKCHKDVTGAKQGHFSAHDESLNINCIECHSEVLTGKHYETVVHARAVDPSTGQPGKILYTWALDDLQFKWHVAKKNSLCTDCHRNISHDKVGTKKYQVIMESCAGCHYHAAKDDYVQMKPLPVLTIEKPQEQTASTR